MKVVAIIQARMGSTRLPNKVLAYIHGRPMLKILIERLRLVSEIDDIVIATTEDPRDDVLEAWANKEQISCFRGSEHDVLERFYLCAIKFEADIVIRITADDPLKDPAIIRRILSFIKQDPSLDYCSNTIKPTYPEGLDIEIFRRGVLQQAYEESMLQSEREHVTPYIWKNPDKFCLKNIEFEHNLSHWRWTVDKYEDMEFMTCLLQHFEDPISISYLDIITFLNNNPDILKINTLRTVRNEGYLKSLKMEEK